MFKITNLQAKVLGKTILKKINLEIKAGQIAVLEGVNGSGKSTLAQVILGNPLYQVSGKIEFFGQNMIRFKPEERSKLGVFVSFQEPPEIAGVSIISFLKTVVNLHPNLNQIYPTTTQLLNTVKNFQDLLGLETDFYKRDLGFSISGGQKKKLELLQMLVLQPKLIVLDEIDSGLDTFSLSNLATWLKILPNKERVFLIITHNTVLKEKLLPDLVWQMQDGSLNLL